MAESTLTVSDTPTSGQSGFSGNPETIMDPRLLVTVTKFTDGAGVEHERSNPIYVRLYGRSEISRQLLSDADSVADLSEWWISIFGQPISRLNRIRLAAHFEDDSTATTILGLTVGDTITSVLSSDEGETATETLQSVDGVQWRIGVLNPNRGLVSFDTSLLLFPPPVRQYWRVGTRAALGADTAIAVEQSNEDLGLLWTRDELVTLPKMNRTIVCTRIPTYDNAAQRDAVENQFLMRGSTCIMLDDQTIRVWNGWNWVVTRRW